ncbi:MAG: histidinol dehydrogenase [Treponema sp.]|jgi:histidinol dehydrogenase|nr:histidinol dehydrogenase [Treponema sp.]
MHIIDYLEFDDYWRAAARQEEDSALIDTVQRVINAVRCEGDAAVRCFAAQFDKSAPQTLEVSPDCIQAAYQRLERDDPELHWALSLAATHIRCFAEQQKAQLVDFEYHMADGLVTGQRVIPVQRAGIYAPAGRFPLISTVLMDVIPALLAGVDDLFVASPPLENGLPDERVMAAAYIAGAGKVRVFAMGGAQAIAALALGTETVPRVDVIAGPGNKYVATAKRLLYGETGIDFIAGPSDILIIADAPNANADIIAADMLAQAEHDPDACARALVPDSAFAALLVERLNARLDSLPTAQTARASLDAGGLIITYAAKEDAVRIANTIAPEHLELQVAAPDVWIPCLRNYGSLFIGSLAAEVLGDYSAGISNTLPTAGSARFTGGLSVRHFLKTLTTLRCAPGSGYDDTRRAAQIIARAEGLAAHAESAAIR